MNRVEFIDRICAVNERQAKIIRLQAIFIEEQCAVDEEVKRKFAAMRDEVDGELDLIEFELRPYHNTACGKE